jgi:hypothetical protein
MKILDKRKDNNNIWTNNINKMKWINLGEGNREYIHNMMN